MIEILSLHHLSPINVDIDVVIFIFYNTWYPEVTRGTALVEAMLQSSKSQLKYAENKIDQK